MANCVKPQTNKPIAIAIGDKVHQPNFGGT